MLGGEEEVGHLIRSAGWGGGGSPYKRMLVGKGMGHLVLGEQVGLMICAILNSGEGIQMFISFCGSIISRLFSLPIPN